MKGNQSSGAVDRGLDPVDQWSDRGALQINDDDQQQRLKLLLNYSGVLLAPNSNAVTLRHEGPSGHQGLFNG